MFKRNAALLIVAGLIVGGGAVAWARSDTSRPTLAATTAAGTPGANGARRAGARGLLARVVHGDLIVRGAGGKFQNVVYDRGKEKALAGDKLTITRPDGVDVTVTLTNSTKYRGVQDSSGLQVGHPTLVLSLPDSSALVVAQPQRAGANGNANPGARAGASANGSAPDVFSGFSA